MRRLLPLLMTQQRDAGTAGLVQQLGNEETLVPWAFLMLAVLLREHR
jgi:hypothetical protein